MRILWILNGCGLEGGSITGGPVRFHEISRRWQGRDCEQLLMTTLGGETMLRGMGCSLDAVRVPASLLLKREPVRAFRLWSYAVTSALWKSKAKCLAAFLSGGVESTAITVSDYFCDIVPALCLKRRTGCRWIAWIHHRETPPSLRPGNRLVNTLTYRMQEWSLRRIAKFADSAWIYDTDAGDLVRERLLDFGMEPSRIRIMKCGVNVAEIEAAPEPEEKAFDAAMIGVRPNKGMYDIVPVWERVVAQRPGTTLRLMGGMSGEGTVLDDIKARGLGEAISVFRPEGGFLPASDYYAQIKTARLLFAPSHEEGWGMAVCEAMAAGVPVVGYDLPVYRRIYGNAFLKVRCFDADDFARKIVRLLDDQSLFDEYRRRGLACAASYGWDAIAASDRDAIMVNDTERRTEQ